MTVAVIYFSEAGTTHQVAQAIAGGVEQQGALCRLLRVTDAHIVDSRFDKPDFFNTIDESSAVIFGSPTYMGGPASQFKAFCDASSDCWDSQRWSGKLAAGFTVGSNPGGDQLATLQYFSILAAQHGMLWVNLEMPVDHEQHSELKLQSQLGFAGVVPSDTISPVDKENAFRFGSRVAEFSKRFRHNAEA